MSDRREQLLEIIEDAAKGETKATLRAELAALRAAVPEEGPVVEQLKWGKYRNGDADAVTLFGEIYTAYAGGSWRVTRNGKAGKFIQAGDDLDAAKAAAQADYERHIRSALVPAPRPDMERELAEVIEQRDYFKAEAEAGTEYITAQREKIDLLGRELAEARAAHAEAVTMAAAAHRDAVAFKAERDALAAAIQEAREVVSAIAGENQPAREWAVRVRDKIDAALSGASIPAPAEPGRKMEPVSIDYLRGQIGEILVLELDAKEDGRAVSQAVERILALVAASSAPDKAEARREALEYEDEQDPSGRIAAALISNPARREGE